jgi:hypothetical protein
MPLSTAQSFAWGLAATLMVVVILYRAGDGYGVLPAAEYDGDPRHIVTEYDPFGV